MAGDGLESADEITILEHGNAIELQVNGIDNGPRPGSFSFTRGRRERNGTFRSSQSQFSTRTATGISRVLSWRSWITNRSSVEPGPRRSAEDDQARDDFLRLITARAATEAIPQACQLYASFLESKFRSAWAPLLRPVLFGINDYSNEPLNGEIAVVYRFLTLMAKLFLTRQQLALSDIIDELQNTPAPRTGEARQLSVPSQTSTVGPRRHTPEQGGSNEIPSLLKDQDIERMVPYQLAFAAVGWLTMLIDPAVRPRQDTLEIRRLQTTNMGRYFQPHRTFTSYSSKMDFCDQPIFLLLRRFGNLIPDIQAQLAGEAEGITASCVCFSTLHKVVEIKIEWVHTLSEHLEFDSRQKTLKVFRFPSFCKMMYQDRTLLSGLFEDDGRFRGANSDTPDDLTQAYFREILVSYRLIFGQDSSSPKIFQSWSKKQARSSTPPRPPPSTTLLPVSNPPRVENDSADLDIEVDPLIQLLCAKHCECPEARAFYAEIHALDISPYYYPEDFPFLRRRILNLQSFVQGRNPHTLKALWNDRRNIAFWWTFWAVVFIGGPTVLISILQLGFDVWAALSGQRQVDQGASKGGL